MTLLRSRFRTKRVPRCSGVPNDACVRFGTRGFVRRSSNSVSCGSRLVASTPRLRPVEKRSALNVVRPAAQTNMDDDIKREALDTVKQGRVEQLPTSQSKVTTFGPLHIGLGLFPTSTPLTPATIGYEVLILTVDLFLRHKWPDGSLKVITYSRNMPEPHFEKPADAMTAVIDP